MQPDLVILNFDMSDVSDDYRFRRDVTFDKRGKPICCIHPGLEIRKLSGNQLVNEVLLIPRWGRQTLTECWTSRLFSMPQTNISASTCKYLWLDDQAPDWTIHIHQTLEPILELQQQCLAHNSAFVVLMAPAPFQVSERACNDPGLRKRVGVAPEKIFQGEHPFEIVYDFCKKNRIPLCDSTPPFLNDEGGERFFLRHAVELSPEGHAILSRSLAVYLVKNFPGAWRNKVPSRTPSQEPATLGGSLSQSEEAAPPIRDSQVRSAGVSGSVE